MQCVKAESLCFRWLKKKRGVTADSKWGGGRLRTELLSNVLSVLENKFRLSSIKTFVKTKLQ